MYDTVPGLGVCVLSCLELFVKSTRRVGGYFFICATRRNAVALWLCLSYSCYMSNYNVTASRFSVSAFACGDSVPLKGVSVMSVSILCSDSGFSPVVVDDSNQIGEFLPAIKFCPVCGTSVSWGWFGISHLVTDIESGARVWAPNEWLVSS